MRIVREMKENYVKRLVSILLALFLVAGMMPSAAFAAYAEDVEPQGSQIEEPKTGDEEQPVEQGEEEDPDAGAEGGSTYDAGVPHENGIVDAPSGTYGSGSYMMNENPAETRFYTEFMTAAGTGADKTSEIPRKTVVKVYLKDGELLYMGSSVHDSRMDLDGKLTGSVTGDDIVLTLPDGSQKGFDVKQNDVGYISNHTQEKNGPRLNADDQNDTSKYKPLYYQATAPGTYTVEFHSQTGLNNKNNPTPCRVDAAWNQMDTYVAAWDLTVVGLKSDNSGTEVKSGRAWADYLSLNTGSGSAAADLDVHVLTNDGYVYKVDMSKIAPGGFIFFANNMGFTTRGGTPYSLYHSFYSEKDDLSDIETGNNVTVHKPFYKETNTQETYKIFFNKPNDDLIGTTVRKDVNTAEAAVSDLSYKGFTEGMSRYGQGGVFTFNSKNATSVTLKIDLNAEIEALKKQDGHDSTVDEYKGSGIIELNGSVSDGINHFKWDGRDSSGQYVPVGIYADSSQQRKVEVSYKAKSGEIHFPLIDVEGILGGIKVQRITNPSKDDEARNYDLYYNNLPLKKQVIKETDGTRVQDPKNRTYYVLTDKTRTAAGDKSSWTLTEGKKAIEGKNVTTYDEDTKEYKPVDSRTTSMLIQNNGYSYGGNRSGIDMWTYYTRAEKKQQLDLDFAIVPANNTGQISGIIFKDDNRNGTKDTDEKYLKNVSVRLMNEDGTPVMHKEELPVYDDNGYFKRDENGDIITEETESGFVTETDANGHYQFTGVPYKSTGARYYVQVMLTEVETDVLKYLCTTAKDTKIKGDFPGYSENKVVTGGDGAKFTSEGVTYSNGSYSFKYERADEGKGELLFNKDNAQYVTLTSKDEDKSFNPIGYYSAVQNSMNYTVKKKWGGDTVPMKSIMVELYFWDPTGKMQTVSEHVGRTRRTGALIDRQELSADNDWSYTWENVDGNLQYYVVEYYIKKDQKGEVIYNDKNEPRLVLLGGTMPIFSSAPDSNTANAESFTSADVSSTFYGYGFDAELGGYGEKIQTNTGDYRVPAQYFGDEKSHKDASTEEEKQSTIDTDARLYDLEYTLTAENEKNKTITLKNSQTYDEKTYYVWLNHERELTDFMSKTTFEGNEKHVDSVEMTRCDALGHDHNGNDDHIVGLTISSLDAAGTDYSEGNSTDSFRFDRNNPKSVYFTANESIYHTGTGTRTYKAEYTVDKDTKEAVPVHVEDGKLVDSQGNSAYDETRYITYTWTLTIHVYDANDDGAFVYNPTDDSESRKDITVQKALDSAQRLNWELVHDDSSDDPDKMLYINDDNRTEDSQNGLIDNDVYRVPLFKHAVSPHMGSCTDLIGVAYSPDGVLTDEKDISKLTFYDTDPSRRAGADSSVCEETGDPNHYIIHGNNGDLHIKLNVNRSTKLDRGQDHLNYANIYYSPKSASETNTDSSDVFYYKIIVFDESATYTKSNYERLGASEGVEMYACFELEPSTYTIEKEIIGRSWKSGETVKFDVRSVYDPTSSSSFNPLKSGTSYEEKTCEIKAEDDDHKIGVELSSNISEQMGAHYKLITESDDGLSDDLKDGKDTRTYIIRYDVDKNGVVKRAGTMVLTADKAQELSSKNTLSSSDMEGTSTVDDVRFTNKTKAAKATIKAYSLTIGNQVDVNFFVYGVTNNSDDTNYIGNFFLKFNDDSEEYKLDADLTSTSKDGTVMYGSKYSKVYAYRMGDNIEAKLYYRNPDDHKEYLLSTKTYSVQKYADNMIGKSSTNDYLKAMLIDMLNYGAAAQLYAAAQDWEPLKPLANINRSHNEKQLAKGKDSEPDDNYQASCDPDDLLKDVTIIPTLNDNMSVSLRMEFKLPENVDKSEIVLDFKSRADADIKTSDGTTGDVSEEVVGGNNYRTISIDGEQFVVNGEGKCSFTIRNVPPFFWNDMYELSFKKKKSQEKVFSLKYGYNTYLYRMYSELKDSSKENELLDLIQSMYKYQDTASKYYASKNNK